MAKAYGVLGTLGFAARWTFVIGRDGKILSVDKDVKTETHGKDVAATLARLGIPRRAAR